MTISELSSKKVSTANNQWLLVNPCIMIGFIGAISSFVWLFLALSTSVYVPHAEFSNTLVGIVHVSFAVGLASSLLISWIGSNFFSKNRLFLLALATVFSATACFGMGIENIAITFGWLFSMFMGFGLGFMYVLYGEFICLFFKAAIRSYIYGIFLCASFVCLGILFAGPTMEFWFGMIFPTVSIVSYVLIFIFFKINQLPAIDSSSSDLRQKIVWRSFVATATTGLAVGFACGCILSSEKLGSWEYVVMFIVAFLVCLYMFIDAIKKYKLNESVTMHLFLPFSAIIVFPIIFVPESLRFVFAFLLLCMALFPITMSLSAICKHIVICQLSPIRAFSFGRLMTILGLIVGLVIGFIAFSQPSIDAFGGNITTLMVVTFMILVIFSATFVMTEDNYPNDDRFRWTKSDNGAPENIQFIPKTGSLAANKKTLDTGDASINRSGFFYQKCEQVAKNHDLSARQQEVLTMLAKGRNAEYITEKLVISSHTAKAHIYNIYQKTGVHSRQELMNLVEETNLD